MIGDGVGRGNARECPGDYEVRCIKIGCYTMQGMVKEKRYGVI